MAELKTKVNDQPVAAFLDGVADEGCRQDCYTILEMMKKATHAEPKMWGDSIVGFGSYHYTYASGRGGDWLLTGFSPRKQNLTLYIFGGFERYEDLLGRLGKHTLGKGCVYIKHLGDVDQDVLRQLVKKSVEQMRAEPPA